MQLEELFTPFNLDEFEGISLDNSWLYMLNGNFEHTLSWKDADIALIGFDERRGCDRDVSHEIQSGNAVRSELYKLKKGRQKNYKVVDLGNLNPLGSLDKSYHLLADICTFLIQNGVFPIIIGGAHNLSLGQFLCSEKQKTKVNCMYIDHVVDIATKSFFHTHRHIADLVKQHGNAVHTICHLGHQEYLIDAETHKWLADNQYDALSLGQIRNSISEVEPYFREVDYVSIDLDVLKFQSSPFGFTPEEFCQLGWYAGNSNRLDSFGIYEYFPEKDEHHYFAQIIAVMIWYFVEGFYNRTPSFDLQKSQYTKYIIPIEKSNENLIFFKEIPNDKWWMLLDETSSCMIPCSYQDYLTASKGDLPDRWVRAIARR